MKSKAKNTIEPRMKVLVWSHFIYTMATPLIAAAALLMLFGQTMIGILTYNIFAFLIYYTALIRFYRIGTNFWVVLFSTVIPLLLMLFFNIVDGSLIAFFIETLFLEIGAMMVGILVVSYSLRPSGWSGAILVSPVIVFFLYSFGTITWDLLDQASIWWQLIYIAIFINRSILHTYLYVPPAKGGELPIWAFSGESATYMSPLSEEQRKKTTLVFSLILICVFIFIPSAIIIISALFEGIF